MTIDTSIASQKLSTPYVLKWINDTFPAAPFTVNADAIQVGGGDMWMQQPMSVGVLTHLEGCQVNCWDADYFLNLLPLGPRGMGMPVDWPHPMTPGWADRARPALESAITEALALLTAHRDGQVCRAPHPRQAENRYGWACLRAAGHDQLDGWRAHHAMTSGHVWDTDGVMQR